MTLHEQMSLMHQLSSGLAYMHDRVRAWCCRQSRFNGRSRWCTWMSPHETACWLLAMLSSWLILASSVPIASVLHFLTAEQTKPLDPGKSHFVLRETLRLPLKWI